jgi:hypothetical protein
MVKKISTPGEVHVISDASHMMREYMAKHLLKSGTIIEVTLRDGDKLLTWYSVEQDKYLGVLDAFYEVEYYTKSYPVNLEEYVAFVRYIEVADTEGRDVEELCEDGWWDYFSNHSIEDLRITKQLLITPPKTSYGRECLVLPS